MTDDVHDYLEYSYPGQWFDDAGSLTHLLDQSPVLGFDISMTPGVGRQEINDMARSLIQSDFQVYDS